MNYQWLKVDELVRRLADAADIPNDPANLDWQRFQAEGGQADPADPVPAALAAIEAARDTALRQGVALSGKQWHTDQIFQGHLTGIVAAFEAGILPANATVPIRTMDNTIEQLSYAELKQLAGAVLTRVQEIWAASWAAKDALP